jgi:hypothetical protein
MWWIASVAIICSIFVISLMIGYAVMHWRRHKAELLQSENMKYDQKYILTSSPYHKREPTSGIPYTSNEPVNIQPHFKTLQSMDVAMFIDKNLNNNNSGLQSTPEYQLPLVSHYESERAITTRKSRKIRKRSIKDSYGATASNVIETPTIVISQVPDNNANFAKIESNAKPELTFSIFYDVPSKDLHITVIKASNLPRLKHFESGTQYFRVRVCVGACSKQYHETRYVCGTRAPVFSETFIVSGLAHHKLRECTVGFAVIEFEELQHCWTVVGEVSQPLIDLRANTLLKATKTLHKI